MDLNKHIVTDANGSPFHSNGFACVNNPNRIGSTGSISFSKRQEIDKNRKLVYGYQRSAIGSSYGALRANAIKPKTGVAFDVMSRQRFNSTNSASNPIRKYNPFS